MSQYSKPDLTNVLCLGVAGNFAGHLEQAGETPDFVNVKTATAKSPKGIFPYYVPHHSDLLGKDPLSSSQIKYPDHLADNAHLQAEPEVCVLFDVVYNDNLVSDLKPKAFAAFNDCSIRKPGAKKISEKKNWGPATKGLSEQFIELNSFDTGCELDKFNIASFLKRDGQFYAYGKDSPVTTYSYFHRQLQDWMIDKLNHQQDFGPLENLREHIKTAQRPQQIMVSLGGTAYTEFGEHEFLRPGDELFFYVYDASKNSPQDVSDHLNGKGNQLVNSSILHQRIV